MSLKESLNGKLFRDLTLGPLGNALYNKAKGRDVSLKQAMMGETANKYLSKKKGGPAPALTALFSPMQAPTKFSTDVVQAGRDARRLAAKRLGYMATIKAGETNSNAAYASTAGVRSLIGVP